MQKTNQLQSTFIEKCKGPLTTALLAVGYDEVTFDEWVTFTESRPRLAPEGYLPSNVVVCVGRTRRSGKEKYFIYPFNETN